MSDDNKPKKYIELTPNFISKIVSDKDEYDAFVKALREGTTEEFFKRDSKALGGKVGSLMDKSLLQQVPVYRVPFAEGGMSRDEEIGFHMFIVSMRNPVGSELYAVQQSRDWLEKNLTPAEKRMFEYPR